jgi:hypothetical protein
MTLTLFTQCRQCSKNLRGRTDKKFCDDYCRNQFNNQLKAVPKNLVRNINHALTKNRRIMESIIAEGPALAKVTRENLLQEGFQFRFITHLNTHKAGTVYYCCYDYAYLLLEEEEVLIVQLQT